MPKPRKVAVRQVKPRVFIYCEGEKTEPNYIRAYINAFHPACARLKGAEKPINLKSSKKNTPKQLVEEAVTFARSLDFKGDQVWVMYDRESPARYSDDDHSQSWLKAERNGIKIALSNVCFEYWLLLHLIETSQPFPNCDALISSLLFKQTLRDAGISNYEKGEAGVAETLVTADRIHRAKTAAQRINQQSKLNCDVHDSERPYRLNPYTNVYEVLDDIDKVAAQ